MPFVGTYKLSIDNSRIVLPKEVSSEIGSNELILFFNEKRREIFFYTGDSVKEFMKTVPLDPNRIPRRTSRMLASAHKAQLDGKRRLMLPKSQRDKARLSNSCSLIGQGNLCVLKAKGGL